MPSRHVEIPGFRVTLHSSSPFGVKCAVMTQLDEARLQTDRPILVTGASGFVALHLVHLLLRHGHRVRGTLRDPSRASSLCESITKAGLDTARAEFVKADLNHDEGWREALENVEFAFHVASPVPQRPARDDSELVTPAREGTLRVLRAARTAGVRRVVLTSSVSAIMQGHARDGKEVLSEDDWSIVDERIPAYDKSKTLAERAAWEFLADMREQAPFELVAINPGFILGPALDSDHGTSNELVRKLITRAVPGLPDLFFPIIHVQDVAELHWRAMCAPGASGLRLCCALPAMSSPEIADVLERAGYRVPRRRIPDWMIRLVGLFDRQVAVILPELGKRDNFDCSRVRSVLGWNPRSAESAILDAARSLVSYGLAS